MNIWVKILPVSAIFSLCLSIPIPSFAHPGRTASDGCHYCRTNCDSWGVAWNERHCHNGGVAQPIQVAPTTVQEFTSAATPTLIPPTRTPATPRPTRVPTRRPTKIPTPNPTATVIPTIVISPTSEPNETPSHTVTPAVLSIEFTTQRNPSSFTRFLRWLFGQK